VLNLLHDPSTLWSTQSSRLNYECPPRSTLRLSQLALNVVCRATSAMARADVKSQPEKSSRRLESCIYLRLRKCIIQMLLSTPGKSNLAVRSRISWQPCLIANDCWVVMHLPARSLFAHNRSDDGYGNFVRTWIGVVGRRCMEWQRIALCQERLPIE
jgi:hypothetical protein